MAQGMAALTRVGMNCEKIISFPIHKSEKGMLVMTPRTTLEIISGR